MQDIATGQAGRSEASSQLKEALAEPFIAAASLTLREMAGIEMFPRDIYRLDHTRSLGDISAVVTLTAALEGPLVLGFRTPLATALATRVLSEVTDAPEEAMIADCLGEIANVVAGQAKTVLAQTPYAFMFAPPNVVCGVGQDLGAGPGVGCLVIAFVSDLGEFTLQLGLKPDG